MAETNSTSSATNSDCNAASPSVPGDAGGISRRKLMQVATSAAVVPAVALLPITPALANQADRSKWNAALADFERAEAAYKVVDAEYSAANRAYEAEQREPNPDFEKYRLGRYVRDDNPEERIFQAARCIAITDYVGHPVTAEDYVEITKKAANLIAESDAHRAHADAVYARTIGKIEDAWEAAFDKFCMARDKLLDTPAPDARGMLFKLELLAREMDGANADDADFVTVIRDDARRIHAD